MMKPGRTANSCLHQWFLEDPYLYFIILLKQAYTPKQFEIHTCTTTLMTQQISRHILAQVSITQTRKKENSIWFSKPVLVIFLSRLRFSISTVFFSLACLKRFSLLYLFVFPIDNKAYCILLQHKTNYTFVFDHCSLFAHQWRFS